MSLFGTDGLGWAVFPETVNFIYSPEPTQLDPVPLRALDELIYWSPGYILPTILRFTVSRKGDGEEGLWQLCVLAAFLIRSTETVFPGTNGC